MNFMKMPPEGYPAPKFSIGQKVRCVPSHPDDWTFDWANSELFIQAIIWDGEEMQYDYTVVETRDGAYSRGDLTDGFTEKYLIKAGS